VPFADFFLSKMSQKGHRQKNVTTKEGIVPERRIFAVGNMSRLTKTLHQHQTR
jgi:hypothetical protein